MECVLGIVHKSRVLVVDPTLRMEAFRLEKVLLGVIACPVVKSEGSASGDEFPTDNGSFWRGHARKCIWYGRVHAKGLFKDAVEV